jgi:hypothetical protein
MILHVDEIELFNEHNQVQSLKKEKLLGVQVQYTIHSVHPPKSNTSTVYCASNNNTNLLLLFLDKKDELQNSLINKQTTKSTSKNRQTTKVCNRLYQWTVQVTLLV